MLTRQYKTLEERDWAKVHEALDAYFKYDAEMDDLLDVATDSGTSTQKSKKVEAIFDKQAELRIAAGMAFMDATSDINSMSNAKYVSVDFMVRCSNYTRG